MKWKIKEIGVMQMCKILKSVTFWFFIISFFVLIMHQMGEDSKNIVLIQLIQF